MIEIFFLGTSSSVPTSKRNHTAILLSYKNENILVDCGEGTQRQFKKAKINPGRITRILITHLHGDHVFGLPGLLKTLEMSEYNKKLIIYGPTGIKKHFHLLEEIYGKFNTNIEIKEMSNSKIDEDEFLIEAFEGLHTTRTNAYNFIVKEKIRLNKSKIKKLKLPNSPLLGKLQKGQDVNYEGKKIKWKEVSYIQPRKKISFVLDTSFTNSLADMTKEADIIISEATFGSDEKEKAKEHFHMTYAEAGNLAKKAKAKRLILTHISQKHEKDLKRILSETKKIFKETSIAEDMMKVSID